MFDIKSWNRGVGAWVGLAMMGMAGTANATLITQQIDFTASGFPAAAPTDPVIGSVTLTYDPMGGDITNQTTDITLNSLNISIAGTVIAFSYDASSDLLSVGGLVDGAGVTFGTNDFVFSILNVSTAPTALIFLYTTEDTFSNFDTGTIAFNVSTVPEPSALALFSVGLAMLVLLRLRRRWSLAFRDSVAWIVGSYPCAPNRRLPNCSSV